MTPAGRTWALVRLRWKLSLRSGRKALGVLAVVVGALFSLGFAVGLGVFGYKKVASAFLHGNGFEDVVATMHAAFFLTWTFQVFGAIMIAANDQFLDLSRLLHLPLRPREIFAATQLSGLLNWGQLILIGFPAGVALALPGTPADVAARLGVAVLSTIAARGFATALASTLQTFLGRRRLRDVMIVVSALFALIPVLLRRKADDEFRNGGGEIAAFATSTPLPSTPFANLYAAAGLDGGAMWSSIAWIAGLIVAGLWLSERAFARLLRSVDDRQAGERVRTDGVGASLFPAEIAVVAQATRRLWWREPRLRAILIQNTLIFGLMGIFGSSGEVRHDAVPPVWLPMVLLFAHGTFMTTQLSIDGPGIGLGFATGMSRFRFVVGRAWGILSVLVPSSLFVIGIPMVMSVIGRNEVPLVDYLPIVVAVVLMETVGTALGAVVSVFLPSPALGSAKRREVSARDGCGRAVVYMLFAVPAALCALPCVLLAIFPWMLARFRFVDFDVPLWWIAFTVPAAVLIAVVESWALLRVAAVRLESDEEKILHIVSATS